MSLLKNKYTWISVVSLTILIVLFSTIWVSAGHGLWTFLRYSWLNIVLGLITIGLVITGFMARDSRETQSYGYGRGSREPENPSKTHPWVFFSAAIVAGLTIFAIIPFQMYLQTAGMLKATEISKTDDAASLSFAERVPFDVAEAVSTRSLGDTLGNTTGGVKSIPLANEYTTSVVRRGVFQGYESVQVMNLPLFGAANTNKDVKFCKYNENANLRLGGAGFNNSMSMRVLMGTSPSTAINSSDAIAMCEGDTPMLYMPMTKLSGGIFPHRIPAGVAIYNGSTGELKIEKDISNSKVSVYPKSLAESQRIALHTENGFADYVFNRAGFDDTSKDAEDPNSPNHSEFSLKNAKNDETSYVTPLTPRGSSSSIVGLSTVDSNTVSSGKLNALSIHKYGDSKTREANSTVASTIISSVLEGYKANGLTVFEVIPAADGTWTASIGKNQSILYRANIAVDGSKVTLIDVAGNKISGNLSIGGIDAPPNESNGAEPSAPVIGKRVDQMTVEELKSLADSITSELVKRASSAE